MSPAAATATNARVAPLRSRRCTVNLHYPDSWAVRPNPMADELARRARNWLRQRGVITTAADEDKFHNLSVGEYANWPFPFAEEDRAEVITNFLALWIFYEDILEEGGDGQSAAVLDAIRGLPAPAGSVESAHLRCWRELGEACATVMSAAWTERHARRFAEWVDAVVEESVQAQILRKTGVYPSLAEHLKCRRANIGMAPNLDFIEYQIGWELPEEVLADSDMKAVESAAADCVAICNDLFGFTKDRRSIWANFVSCAMNEFGDDAGEAFKWVTHMHSRKVQELRQHEALLLKRYPQHPMLTAWFDALHCVIYGFAQWHSRAPRYRAIHESGCWRVQLTITPACPDPF